MRILASARNAGVAFDLRCEIREALVTFLAEAYPDSLPRFRAELDAPRSAAGRKVVWSASDAADGTTRVTEVSPPTAAGFGTRMVKFAAQDDHGGSVELD